MTIIDQDSGEIIDPAELALLDELSLLTIFRKRSEYLSTISDPIEAIAERDKGMALKECLERKGASLETQNAVAAYTVQCEYTAGTLYVDMPKNEGTRLGGNMVFPPDDTPTLYNTHRSPGAAHDGSLCNLQRTDFQRAPRPAAPVL